MDLVKARKRAKQKADKEKNRGDKQSSQEEPVRDGEDARPGPGESESSPPDLDREQTLPEALEPEGGEENLDPGRESLSDGGRGQEAGQEQTEEEREEKDREEDQEAEEEARDGREDVDDGPAAGGGPDMMSSADPDDVFCDDAFGEDLPPLPVGSELSDDDILCGLSESGPEDDDDGGFMESADDDMSMGVDEQDEMYWEVSRRQGREDALEIEPAAGASRDEAAVSAAPRRAAQEMEASGDDGAEDDMKIGDDKKQAGSEATFKPVAYDDRDGGSFAFSGGGSDGSGVAQGGRGLSLDRMVSDEDDFFHLVTEELYAREFGRGEEEDIGSQIELLSFRLANEVYAVRLTSIKQIIKMALITMVPRSPDYVLGVISLRGTIIPVFDLRKRLNLPAKDPTRKSRIVVVAQGKFTVGLIVDEVEQVVRIPESGIEPPPSVLAGVEAEYIEGIGRTAKKMIILLSLDKIMVPVTTGKN